jgi:hypothetical protein
MKIVKSLIPTIQLNSIQLDLFFILVSAMLVACAIGTVIAIVASRF